MNAELVHDEDWLQRAWLAANPGVTPTPWDGPHGPTLYALPARTAEPVDLAQYRRRSSPCLERRHLRLVQSDKDA